MHAYSSRVKEMGTSLLRKNTNIDCEEEDDDVTQSHDRLSEDEIKKYQLKLARSLVVFIELLHLLISRNRDLLLDVIQTRKRAEGGIKKQNREISDRLSHKYKIAAILQAYLYPVPLGVAAIDRDKVTRDTEGMGAEQMKARDRHKMTNPERTFPLPRDS
jgi:hypothetical protein